MKRKVILCLVLCMCFLVGCGSSNDENASTEKVQESNPTTETESETEEVKVYTEDEYKAMCQVVYYDDVFKDELEVGEYVKIYGFISEKNTYTTTSTFGIVIDELIEEYDLEKKYLSSCIMHEETKEDAVPSYMGKSVYLLFPNEYTLSADDYETGQKVVIYGEVVQTWSGVFIIPQYIDMEE